MTATYRPFCKVAFLIRAFNTGASDLGLHPTNSNKSVSSMPMMREFIKYWLLKSALKKGAFLRTSMLS